MIAKYNGACAINISAESLIQIENVLDERNQHQQHDDEVAVYNFFDESCGWERISTSCEHIILVMFDGDVYLINSY